MVVGIHHFFCLFVDKVGGASAVGLVQKDMEATSHFSMNRFSGFCGVGFWMHKFENQILCGFVCVVKGFWGNEEAAVGVIWFLDIGNKDTADPDLEAVGAEKIDEGSDDADHVVKEFWSCF